MSLYRTVAILRKEFHHITRDVRLLFLVTFSPAFLLLTFSYVFAMDLEQVTMAVMDQDRSRLAREYLAALTANGDVRLVAEVGSYEQANRLLVAGQADVVLVIPPGFERDAKGGRGASVQLLVDGVDTNTARQTISEFTARTHAFALTLPKSRLKLLPSLEARSRVLYNPSLKSLVSMVPGLLGIVLIMPALALTLALTREKEVGTFEALIATPVRGPEYLIGKLVTYMGTGLGSAIITQMVAILWFRVPFRGQLAVFLLLTLVFYSASMGLSLILATFIIPPQNTVIPQMLTYRNLGLLGNPLSLILPAALGQGLKSAIFILIFYQTFLSLPRVLEEAARLDGASDLRIFFSIAVPSALPAYIVAFIFSVVWYWNETYLMVIFLEGGVQTLPLQLSKFAQAYENL